MHDARRLLAPLAVVALMAAYVVLFSTLSIRQHDAFLTHKEDLGQIDQALWNSLHGRWLVETDDDHQSTRLTDHAEPSLILSSLVFLLWDDVRALLIWQAVAAALGAWAIYELARDVLARPLPAAETAAGTALQRGLSPEWLAVLFALIYLLFPALEAAHLAEFHAAPLASAPIAFALLFLERRQWARFVAACLLVSAVKEEMALVGVMLGLAGLAVEFRDRRSKALAARAEAALAIGQPSRPEVNPAQRSGPRTRLSSLASFILHPSAFVLVLSLAWFVLATFVIIPHFGAAKYGSSDSIYFQRFGDLGATPGAVVRTLLTNPLLVWDVLSQPARLGYLGGLLASVGFLALLSPPVLAISAPLLLANLLSNFPAQYSGDFHYSAPLAPLIVAAAIYGTRRLWAWLRRPWLRAAMLVWLLGCVFLYHYLRGYSPLSQNFYWPALTPHDQRFASLAAQIPPDARLSATPPLFPHLSHREIIYDFPVVADAQYILLDASGVTDMHPNDFRNAVNGLLAGGQFGVLDGADGYILLKRGAGSAVLPDAFFDFARAPGARPQYGVDVTLGDAVRLLGYDVLPDPRWHTMQVRYYWQALRPLEDDLRLYPFYHDGQGKILEDTSQRPMVATTWYPPSRWRVGEVIQTETLPWDVGDAFMLAAGVMHGADWDRKGRRLATSSGETQVELGTFEWQGKTLVRK